MSYGPDTDFGYVCTVTLTLSVWPRVKVMTPPWIMDNNCVKYPDQAWQWGVMARTQILNMCILWPWILKYDLDPIYDLGQGHDTFFGHGQQLCKVLSRCNVAVRRNGSDTDFGYMCSVTLTLEIWPWVKVMTHPWVKDNTSVKYYPDQIRRLKVMAQTRCEQTDRERDGRTDRQTDRQNDRRTDRKTDRQDDWYIPPYFDFGGINMSAKRGARLVPIWIPTTCCYLLENLSHKTTEMLYDTRNWSILMMSSSEYLLLESGLSKWTIFVYPC